MGAFFVVFVVVIQQDDVAEASLTRNDGQGIDGPRAITSGPDGALWFINDFGGSVGRITTGGVVDVFDHPGLVTPSDITTGPDGNLWFTTEDSGLNGSIGRLTTTGAVDRWFFDEGVVGRPRSITAGPDGALWFTSSSSSIGRLTPDTAKCAVEQRRRLVQG